MKCTDCRFDYKESMVTRMFANGRWTKPICGICALERTRKIHRNKNLMFTGAMALGAYHDALKERKQTKEK